MFTAQLQSINSRLGCLILMAGGESTEEVVLKFIKDIFKNRNFYTTVTWNIKKSVSGLARQYLGYFPRFYINATQNGYTLNIASLQFNNDEISFKSLYAPDENNDRFGYEKGKRLILKVGISNLEASKRDIFNFLNSCIECSDFVHKARD